MKSNGKSFQYRSKSFTTCEKPQHRNAIWAILSNVYTGEERAGSFQVCSGCQWSSLALCSTLSSAVILVPRLHCPTGFPKLMCRFLYITHPVGVSFLSYKSTLGAGTERAYLSW